LHKWSIIEVVSPDHVLHVGAEIRCPALHGHPVVSVSP
jgi:hypothetical protein